MSDFDLQKEMRALRVPERNEEYWENFPQQTLRAARRTAAATSKPAGFVPLHIWASGLAVSCVLAVIVLVHASQPRAAQFRKNLSTFHAKVDRLMQDEHGLHRLVEDQS